MSLSVLIPTVPERRELYLVLWNELQRQAAPFGEDVEIHSDAAPRLDMSIGAKRNALMARATNTHLVFFDDDDWPEPHYVSDIMEALKTDPDCVGQVIKMTVDGRAGPMCLHSIRYPKWSTSTMPVEKWGRAWLRGAGHRNPIRTSIARQVQFPDLRFGEDQVWGNAVTQLCKTEVYVERPAFTYRYSTKEEHAKKYGIR